ncbi:6-phosphogluconolactonase [Saccharomycopsis crataegensis]|uniref:6-phosphogluconolactonase-like protein n=1 Tax=Saccharomycopsis crataegensis TaxID=43959 RepID=A0AAV5QHJ4_9ASCO|nr:6-phosphogluconolactonase [Saccharomycopsis crataegensis]
MSDVEVFSYAKTETLAATLGKYILRLQNEVLLKNEVFTVSVSGGSLVKVLQLALIEDPEISKKIHWEKWHIYFSDERLVPLNHPDSNYKLFHDKVLAPLSDAQVAGPEVFTINESLVHSGDDATDVKIAEEYQSLLPKSLSFDLILLGLGPDGHTASLFPGHQGLKVEDKWIFNINDSPKPPPRRISFSLPLISKAKNIAFVAEGAGKAPVIKKIFEDQSSGLPGELVNDLPNIPIKWFVSNDAIAGAPIIVSMFE